jgi:putative ABC transport system ATP-binding protein
VTVIRLEGVRKVFHQGGPNEHTAVDRVSLRLVQGGVTAFCGPSGSGKTTLLGLLGCMVRPTEGRIWLGDREITSLPERFLTEIRRRTFGFVFQQFHLVRGITALENVMLPAYPLGLPHEELKRSALRLLAEFGLESKASSRVEWLSGGESQRVAIARALVNEPAVVIADEPTAHLDSRASADFMDIVSRLREAGKTILIASHDPVVYESGSVGRVVTMKDGRIEGEPG